MFYQFTADGRTAVEPENISADVFTAGYVDVAGLAALYERFGFAESTVDSCRNASAFFRTGVEVYKDYTFTELRILNSHEESDDYIALYLKKNLLLVVDIDDADGSTREKLFAAMDRYPAEQLGAAKLLCAFVDALLAGDHKVLEALENDLSEQEEALLEKDPGSDFNSTLLGSKKLLSQRHAYYAQLLDIADAVGENDNDIFSESGLLYVSNLEKRISRLYDDTANLKNTVEHLQDAYSAYLDIRMNQTMKIFTVLTSIFFPLTIIVGWYGMNFQYMPEFAWKYGYVYVIALSIVTVLILIWVGKRKKWF